jgi:hypothetical protein
VAYLQADAEEIRLEVDSTAKRLALEEPREIEAMTGEEFEIRDPDTGAVIERVERKDMPPAARQAMAEAFQRALDRREIVFTGERNAKGKPIYRSMIYKGDRDPRREN